MFSTGIGLVLKGFESIGKVDAAGNVLVEKPEVVSEPQGPKVPEPVGEVPGKRGIGKLWGGLFGPINDWMRDGEDFNEE
jgi:hypothetical protein